MKPATIAPVYACVYPGLCDIARKMGYALAIHGSVSTDLDLIAVPWVETTADPEELVKAISHHLNAVLYPELLSRLGFNDERVQQMTQSRQLRDPEPKPHGRLAWNLHLMFGCKIDLSIMPKLCPPTP